LLVDYSGELYAVGHNKYGSCGNGNFLNLIEFTKSTLKEKVSQISVGDGVSLMITEGGDLYSCGHRERHGHKLNDHISKPTKLKFDSKIIKVGAGFTHCLAVDEKGKLYSWGDGKCFQLGHGKKDDEKEPKQIKGLDSVFIVDVSCTRG
jgi:alpha-tubulin suppressor-like RCC1 family protein